MRARARRLSSNRHLALFLCFVACPDAKQVSIFGSTRSNYAIEPHLRKLWLPRAVLVEALTARGEKDQSLGCAKGSAHVLPGVPLRLLRSISALKTRDLPVLLRRRLSRFAAQSSPLVAPVLRSGCFSRGSSFARPPTARTNRKSPRPHAAEQDFLRSGP